MVFVDLQSKSSDDEVDTDDDDTKKSNRESCVILIKCYNIFCDFWKTYDDNSLHEWEPTDECDNSSPVEWPDIVHEDTS